MKGIQKPLKIVALAVVMVASTAASSSSTINYRIHYLTEGNSEPGFPYPYVGYTDYYCDGSDVTYGRVTANQEYQFISSC